MNEIPNSWEKTDVGTIYEIVGGGTPDTKKESFWKGNMPWISSADINTNNEICGIRKYINQHAVDNSSTNTIPANSLLVVTRVGLGKVALSSHEIAINQDIQALLPNNYISEKYSLLYLSNAVNYFKYNSRGTTISGVTKKQLKDLCFILPPLNEQHRIVDKIESLFSKLDAGAASLQEAKIQLERYRQSVLKSAMEGRLTEKWREAHKDELEPASVLLERIRQEREKSGKGKKKQKELPPIDTSELPKLPDGWEWSRLEDIPEKIQSGGTPKTSIQEHYGGDIPFAKIEDITSSTKYMTKTINYISPKGLDSCSAWVVPERSILYAMYGVSHGTPIITNIKTATNQAILTMVINESFYSVEFLYYYFKYLKPFLFNKTHGAAQPNLNAGIIKNFIIAVPSLEEQKVIVNIIEKLFSIQDNVTSTINNKILIDIQKQSILKKAFEGRLVPQDPSDEPASVLLEKIKAEREAQKPKKKKRSKKQSTFSQSRLN